MDKSFYLSLANELSAKFGRVSSFVNHGPSIGAYHEEVLKSIIRHMLPDRFSLRTGFVFHPERGPSQQGDILIIDEYHPGAYFFREGDFPVVAEEALACVIEVKTRLNKTSFAKAIKGLYSFQKATTKPNHPVTLLFAYESYSFKPTVLDRWYRSISLPDEVLSYPFAIYALNCGLLCLRKPSDTEWGHCVSLGEEVRGPKLKTLSIFLQTIRKAILSKAGDTSNPFNLALGEDLTVSKQLLRFGSGVHDPAASDESLE
jgi:hypothetical protein